MKSDLKLNPNPFNGNAPVPSDSHQAAAARNELIWIDCACTWETNNDDLYRDNSKRRSGRRDTFAWSFAGYYLLSKPDRTFCMRNSAMQIVTRLRLPTYQRGFIAILSQDVIPARHDVEDPRLIISAEGDPRCHSPQAPAWTLNLDCTKKDRRLAATSRTNEFPVVFRRFYPSVK